MRSIGTLAAYAVFWLAIAALILAVVYNGGISSSAAVIVGTLAIIAVPLLLFGAWGRSTALGKGRSGGNWFAICALTGLIGVIVLLTLPRLTPERRI